ncbi:M48 family metallopeptidase [Spirochaeta cellobiosiphila]|uniref:M48 family metallopeptidase n=1 Tax=Spirochaeta cellobiosiphila TaxID=504483 RepID=UPI00048BB227|nr:M48 family metallopeptidase [Spirochaeta cellobiosiphila]
MPWYSCRFNDGKTSKQQLGQVTVGETQLVLEYEEDRYTRKLTWPYTDVFREEMPGEKRVSLLCGQYPKVHISVEDPFFKGEIDQKLESGSLSRKIYKWFFTNYTKIILGFVLTIGVLVGVYIYGVPLMADGIARILPYEQEKQMGDLIFKNMSKDLAIDETGSQKLQKFWDDLDWGEHPVNLYLSNKEEMNAFAIMGGHIVVYKDLLVTLDTPEELAALLAHEYSHIEKKHSARLIFRMLSNYLIISLLINDYSGTTAVILQNADSFRTLKYSRDFETEADERGVELLRKEGISPQAMADLFTKLKEQDHYTGPSWLSTHPDLNDRINRIIGEVTESQKASITHHPQLSKTFGSLQSYSLSLNGTSHESSDEESLEREEDD